jgi:hypothetical protein
MLNSYIKHKGITQTLMHNNNLNQFNEINWDAEYDGNMANISVTSNTDGKKQNYNFSLDNQDLASILNMPNVNIPLDKRLKMDFENPSFSQNQDMYQLELPNFHPPLLNPLEPSYKSNKSTMKELLKPTRFLSSPLSNEELIIPITIDGKTNDNYTLTPKKHHKRKKHHKTYKVIKKHKSHSKSRSKSRNSKNMTLF